LACASWQSDHAKYINKSVSLFIARNHHLLTGIMSIRLLRSMSSTLRGLAGAGVGTEEAPVISTENKSVLIKLNYLFYLNWAVFEL